MWIVDPQNYANKKVNEATLKLYGYSREEMLSLTIFDLHPEKEVGKLKRYLSKRTEEEFKVKGIWMH